MRPGRHRNALLTWAVVYPLITGLLIVLNPILEGLALPLRTLVLTAIMVPVMTYVALPAALWMIGCPSRPDDGDMGDR